MKSVNRLFFLFMSICDTKLISREGSLDDIHISHWTCSITYLTATRALLSDETLICVCAVIDLHFRSHLSSLVHQRIDLPSVLNGIAKNTALRIGLLDESNESTEKNNLYVSKMLVRRFSIRLEAREQIESRAKPWRIFSKMIYRIRKPVQGCRATVTWKKSSIAPERLETE